MLSWMEVVKLEVPTNFNSSVDSPKSLRQVWPQACTTLGTGFMIFIFGDNRDGLVLPSKAN